MSATTSLLPLGDSSKPAATARKCSYAVLHVANFYLQSAQRTDPTLSLTGKVAAPEDQRHRNDPALPGSATQATTQTFSPPLAAASVVAGVADPGFNRAPPFSSNQFTLTSAAPLPFAIIAGDTKKSLILQANSAARAAGVEIGMTAPQAQARCGNILLRQRSPSAEKEAQRLLLACGIQVAPCAEDTAPGTCTIDVTGLPPEDRSRHVANAVCQLREQGLHATGGIAGTPLLALYAAHETTSVRTVENASAFLHPLPVIVCDPSPPLLQILQNWGITKLGQLTALPKQDIVRRLGSEGHAIWERARGGEPRPLTPYAPPPQFSASLELEYEIETAEGVLFLLKRFVDRLSVELRTAGQVAAELTLSLKLSDETAHERSFRLPEPTAREDILFRTLHTHLESLRTEACVVGVALHVVPVRPLARQSGLFETGLKDPHGFSETLARVTAIVGSGQLGTPQLEDSYRPDAVKIVPPAPVVPAVDQAPIWPPVGLPLRRYRPPLPAHVELTSNGHPAFLSGPQLHSPVSAVRGPWRSSGDWWKPETWSREEWDIELAVGGLYRIAKVKDEWYVDGEYE